MPASRWLSLLLVACGLVVMTGFEARACSPPPPASWPGWDADPATDVFVGRVSAFTPLPVTEIRGVQVRQARLTVTRLRAAEGRGGPARLSTTIIVEVPRPDQRIAASAMCLHTEPYRSGDTVLIIQPPGQPPSLFSRTWAARSRFAALFEAS